MVLQGIQDRAHNNNLVLSHFTPKEEVHQDNYSGKKIEVGVVSSFAGLSALSSNSWLTISALFR